MADKERPTFGMRDREGAPKAKGAATPPPSRKAPPPPSAKSEPVAAPSNSVATPVASVSDAPKVNKKKKKPELVSSKPKSNKKKYIAAAALLVLAGVGGGVGAMMAGGSGGFQVTFTVRDPNTGVEIVQTRKVKPGQAFPSLQLPVYPGYDFMGWVHEDLWSPGAIWEPDALGTQFAKIMQDTSSIDAAVTLVAAYDARPYTIVLWTNDDFEQTVRKTNRLGKQITITEIPPERLGYEFLGWSEVDSNKESDIIPSLTAANIIANHPDNFGTGVLYTVPLNGKNLYPVWKGVSSADAVFINAKGAGQNTVKTKTVGDEVLITQLPQNATHWVVRGAPNPESIENQYFPGEKFVVPHGGVIFDAVSTGPAVSSVELSFVIPETATALVAGVPFAAGGLTKTTGRLLQTLDLATLDLATLNNNAPSLGSGFTFVRWQVYIPNSEGGTVSDVTQSIIEGWKQDITDGKNQRIVLIPIMNANQVAYKYELGAATLVSGATAPQGTNTYYGNTIQLSSAVGFYYQNKSFAHWAVETSVGTFTFLDGESVTLTPELATDGVVAFKPVWVDVKNLAFFHFNGGQAPAGWVTPLPHTNQGTPIQMPSGIPIRAGHVFVGWNTNQFALPSDHDHVQPNGFGATPWSDAENPGGKPIIYFAIWSSVQFEAVFDKGTQDLNVNMASIPSINGEIAFNSTLTVPSAVGYPTPLRTGYTFSHWELGYYPNPLNTTVFQKAYGTTVTGGAWNFAPGDNLIANANFFDAISSSIGSTGNIQFVFRAVWDINYVRVVINTGTYSNADLSSIAVQLVNLPMQTHINSLGVTNLAQLLATDIPYGTQVTIVDPGNKTTGLKPGDLGLYGNNADFVSFVINPLRIGATQNFDLEFNGNYKVGTATDEKGLNGSGNIVFDIPDVSKVAGVRKLELYASYMFTRVDITVEGLDTAAEITANPSTTTVVTRNWNGTTNGPENSLRHGQPFVVPELANFVVGNGGTEIFEIDLSKYHVLGWTLRRANGDEVIVVAGQKDIKAYVGDVLIPRVTLIYNVEISTDFNYRAQSGEVVVRNSALDVTFSGLSTAGLPTGTDTAYKTIYLPTISQLRSEAEFSLLPGPLFRFNGWQVGYINNDGAFVSIKTIDALGGGELATYSYVISGELLNVARQYGNIVARVVWVNEGNNLLFIHDVPTVQRTGIEVSPDVHPALFNTANTLTDIIDGLISAGNLDELNLELYTARQQLIAGKGVNGVGSQAAIPNPSAELVVERMIRNAFNMPQIADVDLITLSDGTTTFTTFADMMAHTFTPSDTQIAITVKFAGSTLSVDFAEGTFAGTNAVDGLAFAEETFVPIGSTRSFDLSTLSLANSHTAVEGRQLIGFTSVSGASQTRQPTSSENTGVVPSRTFFPLGSSVTLTSVPTDTNLTLYPVYVSRGIEIKVWNEATLQWVNHETTVGNFSDAYAATSGNITLPSSISIQPGSFYGYSFTSGGDLLSALKTSNTIVNQGTAKTISGVNLNSSNLFTANYTVSADYNVASGNGTMTTVASYEVSTRNMVIRLYPVFVDTFVTVNFEGNAGAAVQVQYTSNNAIVINNQNDPFNVGAQHFVGWKLTVPGDTTYRYIPGEAISRTTLNYFFTQLSDTNRTQSVTLTAELENASAAADANREIAGTTVVLNAAHISSGRIIAPNATKIVIAADVTSIPYNAIYAPLCTSIIFSGGAIGQGGATAALNIEPGAFVAPLLTEFYIPTRIGQLTGNPIIGVSNAGSAPDLVVLDSFIFSSGIPLVNGNPRFSFSGDKVLEDRLPGQERILAVINANIETALAGATATRIGGYAISYRNVMYGTISIPRNIIRLDANAISNMPNATELILSDSISQFAGGATSAISGYMDLTDIKINTVGGVATSGGSGVMRVQANVLYGTTVGGSDLNRIQKVAFGGQAIDSAKQISADALNGLSSVPYGFLSGNNGFVEFTAADFGPTVRSIPDFAFDSMTNLVSLTLPKQLDGTIGNGALTTSNNSLATLAVAAGNSRYVAGGGNSYILEGTELIAGTRFVTQIPSTVTNIRNYAFGGLNNTHFEIHANGLTAGQYAFSNNTATKVAFVSAIAGGLTASLDTAIKNIGTAAITIEFNMATVSNNNNWYNLFKSSKVTSARIGANVTSIAGNPFEGATYLTSFVVDGTNTKFAIQDSRILMAVNGTGRIFIAYANGTSTTATIQGPDSALQIIGNFSTGTNSTIFTNGSVIQTINIVGSSNGVDIAEAAFSTAINTKKIIMEQGGTTAHEYAFNGLVNVNTIEFRSNNAYQSTMVDALNNMGYLTGSAIRLVLNPVGALTNGQIDLFNGTHGTLSGVTIGDRVTSITGNPFIGATTLTNFLSDASGITGSGATLKINSSDTLIAYANASSDTVTLSASTNYGNGSENVFTNAGIIKSFTMSTAAGTVNTDAFGSMTSLDMFAGTGTASTWLTTFNANAFRGSTFSGTGTVAITSTATLTGISSTLATALAPISGVKVLTLNAPALNGNLASFLNTTGIPTVSIGANLTSITGNPFVGATSLTTFAGGNTRIAVVLSGKGVTYTSDTLNLASANFLIAQINTAGAASVTHTHVGNGAVIFTNVAAITDVSITSTVQAIGNNAFEGAAFLSNYAVFNYDALKSIGANAFNNTNVSTVAIASASNISGTVAVNAFGNAPITQVTVTNGGAIPTGTNSFGAALLNRMNVTGGSRTVQINAAAGATIGTGYKALLQGMTRGFDLNISATSSGSVAFANGAFSNIPWLDKLTFNNVTSIAGAYDNASAVFVGSGIRTAGDTNLDNGGYTLNLSGLTSVPAYLFSGTSLANPGGIREIVSMPSGTIGEFAFAYNTRLNRISATTSSVAAGIANIASTNIGTYAFAFNRFTTANLTGAHTTSTNIGQYAFFRDTALTIDLTAGSATTGVPITGVGGIVGPYMGATIKVPTALLASFQNAFGWTQYTYTT